MNLGNLSELTVLTETEQPVAVGTLWADKPVVLVFVRHFG